MDPASSETRCSDVHKLNYILIASPPKKDTGRVIKQKSTTVVESLTDLWYSVKGAQLIPSGKEKSVIAFSSFSSSSI